MVDLRSKKEFIYYLNEDYYLIGASICIKLNDELLIQKYNEFIEVVENSSFKDNNVHEIVKEIRDKAAILFDELLISCHVPICEANITESDRDLYDNLIGNYSNEIEAQFERWQKADTCSFYNQVDLQRKHER